MKYYMIPAANPLACSALSQPEWSAGLGIGSIVCSWLWVGRASRLSRAAAQLKSEIGWYIWMKNRRGGSRTQLADMDA